jgi:hypothetical protein
MAARLISFIVLFFNLTVTFSQERLWLKQTKISEVVAFEKALNPSAQLFSKNVSLSTGYYPLADKYQVTNPITAQRTPFAYLPIYAEYFYTPGDSTLRLISYDWEKDRYGNFFDKQKMWKEENSKLDIYNGEYERIKKDLLTQLGTPTTTDTAPQDVNTDGQKYISRKTIWENDVFHAELHLIFASTTYRIRLMLYWKK